MTGADGFIGSHLVEKLVEEGCIVKALSYYNSFNYWGWLEEIDCLDKVESVPVTTLVAQLDCHDVLYLLPKTTVQ